MGTKIDKESLEVDCTSFESQENSVVGEVIDNIKEIAETQELTFDEQRDLLYLERKVERAFYEAGKALQELRDRRLYRNSHETFEDYCADRFGFKRRHPYRLIDAADVVDNLIGTQLDDQDQETQMCPNGTQAHMRTIGTQTDNEKNMTTNGTQNGDEKMCPNGAQILPTSERQVRPLTNLEPDQQREAWATAVAAAGGKVPSGSIVKSIVDQIRERTKVPNPWRVGEVASIIVKENPDLRGKGGCWAVITAVHDFSCTVRLWDGEYQVKPEHLKSFSYAMTDQDKNFFSSLGERISNISRSADAHGIRLNEVEKPVRDFLAGLGKIDRPWLTDLEKRVLRVLEGN